jgi:hypothetical protein
MPTTDPVPSTSPADLLFNAQKLDEVITSTSTTYVDRLGVSRFTVAGALAAIGFEVPVAFASGLTITRASQTVAYSGLTYHANASAIPFTTTGTFNSSQWLLISNITAQELSSTSTGKGSSMIGVEDAGGRFTATTVEGALAESYDKAVAALPKAGGTMAGLLTLSGNASSALHPVTKQQYDAGLLAGLLALAGGGFRNLALSASGTNASITVTASAVVALSDTMAPQVLSPSLSITASASGVNGLDTGTLAAGTWYHVWVIYNPTTSTTAGLLSLSGTAPTMPSGYTHKARVGRIRTDGTANKFPLSFTQFGRSVKYRVSSTSNVAALPAAASGAAGSVTAPTWIGYSLAALVPDSAASYTVVLTVVVSSGSAVSAAPNNSCGPISSTTNPPPLVLVPYNTSGYMGSIQAVFAYESGSVYYASAASGGLLQIAGWEENL